MFFMNFMYFFRKYYNNIIRNELAKQKIYKQTKENSGLKWRNVLEFIRRSNIFERWIETGIGNEKIFQNHKTYNFS